MFKISAMAIAATAILASVGGAAAQSDRIRFECEAEGRTDISMDAKYEDRGNRQKFSTEFEAAPGLGFERGDRIVIRVKNVRAGAVKLVRVNGGDLVGDLNLDTQPNEDAEPFPANFPKVTRGTVVRVLKGDEQILACSLR